MAILLYMIPLFAVLSGFLIYRLNGRHEFLQLDLIQFLYTFILAPLFFIWAKTFVYFLLRSEVGFRLSTGELFTIDTAITLLFIYIYAFLVMHSVTKSFRLQAEKDPLYDLFQHSEYIHLWLSHIATMLGAMMLMVVLALVNISFPLVTSMAKLSFYGICTAGIIVGNIGFVGLWLTDPRQIGRRYMRVMKLAIGLAFAILASVYFIADPDFNARYGLYWFIFFVFSTMLIWSFFTYRSPRIHGLIDRLVMKHKDTNWWGINSQLFSMTHKKETKG